VDFAVKRKKILIIAGPNGAGKSTSGATGNWKLFEKDSRTYVINIDGQDRHLAHERMTAMLRLEGASTHSTRRTVLTSLSRAGVPLRTVQEISGHSSLSQLQIYLAVDPEDTREALQRLKY
jgi:site-specific recombinase XerD